ncbi:MAG TPA: hypothetical protein VK254_00910 [Candidatus Bathyarchaeia archaeon]|nr:hypothetical protein [Candidatus Bathyarchaeia archaeon]
MHLKKIFKIIPIFALIFAWVFSGWPQIGNFPPKIERAQAAITLRAAGAWTSGTSGLTPGIPVAQMTGDLMLCFYGTKPYNDSPTINQGWISLGSATDGTVAAGVDVGSMQTRVFYKIADSDTETDPTITNTTNNVSGAVIVVFAKASTEGWVTPVGAGGGDATAGTGFSVTAASNPGITANDMLVGFGAIRSDAGTQSNISITASGATMGAFTKYPAVDLATTSGGDMAMSGGFVAVSSGTASAAPVYASTLAASHTGSAYIVRLRKSDSPTVTTQAVGSVEATTATGNGNITATGGANADRRGFAYMAGTSGDPTTSDSVAYDDGSFGTGAYTKGLIDLSPGTNYRVRAYAVNSGGTGYGSTVQILTKPAAPTNVAASDGDFTDKVRVTWTKSAGATDYHVWRDSTDLGSAGDVAAFDDTGADAPSITPGSSVASDGTSATQVDLSLAGEAFNDGTSHTYKVVASNSAGSSVDSPTNMGYRGYGAPSYQWQRSSGDSDGGYSDISGADFESYADTGAPADGSARYYRCILSATGLSQQTSDPNRGFKGVISITLETGSGAITYGFVATLQDTTAAGVNQSQTVRNTGNLAEDFNIKGNNSANWVLAAAPGNEQYCHKFCDNGSCDVSPTWTALTTNFQSLAANIAVNGTKEFDLQIGVPTATSASSQQQVDVTVQAVQH